MHGNGRKDINVKEIVYCDDGGTVYCDDGGTVYCDGGGTVYTVQGIQHLL